MITIETQNFNPISQDFYNDIIFSLDLATLPCACGHSGHLIWYGSYRRRLKLSEQTISLRIARVYCAFCGHTHAILLSTIVPYSQVPLDIQVSIIDAFERGLDTHHLPDAPLDLDESNIAAILRAYRCHWRQRLRSFALPLTSLPALVRGSFQGFARQFMQIKRTINHLFFTPT